MRPHCAIVLLGALVELLHQTYATNNDGPAITFSCNRPSGHSFTPFSMAQICFTVQSSHLHFVEVDWGDNSVGTKVGLDAEEGDVVCAPEDSYKVYIGSGQYTARMWVNGVQVYESTVTTDLSECQVEEIPQSDALFAESFEAAAFSAPTTSPTESPTTSPSASPTQVHSSTPSSSPTDAPSSVPSSEPTASPTASPTVTSSASPTEAHSDSPSSSPTASPVTPNPTTSPSITASSEPSLMASSEPSVTASSSPSITASSPPSASPSASPTSSPKETSSSEPSTAPSASPTLEHSSVPSPAPSDGPTSTLSSLPSSIPSVAPTPSPTFAPNSSPTVTASDRPSLGPTAAPTIPDIISDSEGCKDMSLNIECQAEKMDETLVDCKDLQDMEITDEVLHIKWTYSITNNCPHPRTLAQQHITSCSLCIPPGLQCSKEANVFAPETRSERYFTLQPNESANEVEEEIVLLNHPNPCMYSRNIVLRVRGSSPTSEGSFATDLKYTWVAPGTNDGRE